MSNIEDEPPSVLLPCTICSRTFKPEVLDRHIKVCEKTASKKRRVFDSFKNRVSGTELEEFLGPAPLPGQVQKRPVKSPVKKKPPSKWKETHENLIAVLRAARGVQPPPEIIVDSTKHGVNEQCPSCNRFFGPRAFDRHVEFCKEKMARIKVTPSKVSQAQERLEARTKYRAPLSLKPKLTTKEKYSPMLPRKESVETCTVSSTSAKTSPPLPTLNKSSKSSHQNSIKSNSSRSQERQRSVSPKKIIVSNSKSANKNENILNKSPNQPKIKENLKEPDFHRPKTGTRNSAADKNRSCNVKIAQLEDDTPPKLNKSKDRSWKKAAISKVGGSSFPSDDESFATVLTDRNCEQIKKKEVKGANKWSSSESISRTPLNINKEAKVKIEERFSDDERTALKSFRGSEKSKEREKRKDESSAKSDKKAKKQPKHQINDLSVNDESFGIFVAPCGRPNPSSSTPVSMERKIIRKDQKKKMKHSDEEEQAAEETVGVNIRTEPEFKRLEVLQCFDKEKVASSANTFSSGPTVKDDKFKKSCKTNSSKIPKPKMTDAAVRYSYECENEDKESGLSEKKSVETFSLSTPRESIVAGNGDDGDKETMAAIDFKENSESPPRASNDADGKKTAKIKKMAKKWRDISKMSTDDLLQMSEDFDLPNVEDNRELLSESVIWEIAAEQFLKSEESVQSISGISIDSLNENSEVKNNARKTGDDFIVLHVTDPAKMEEKDADMKLSLSEPCFPFPANEVKKSVTLKRSDVFWFSTFPTFPCPLKQCQRKRRRRKKIKKVSAVSPKLSLGIREKTFLASDIPKPKRRKLAEDDGADNREKIAEIMSDNIFEGEKSADKQINKTEFIKSLMNKEGKVCKWFVARDFHIQFLEEFKNCLEDDLTELNNLMSGKKKRRKSYVKKFKLERLKEMRNKREINEVAVSKNERKSSNKKFEYFEINLNDNLDTDENPKTIKIDRNKKGNDSVEGSIDPQAKMAEENVSAKKFEFHDITNLKDNVGELEKSLAVDENSAQLFFGADESVLRNNDEPDCCKKIKKKKILTDVKKMASSLSNECHLAREVVLTDASPASNNQTGSLENIEEADEEDEGDEEDGGKEGASRRGLDIEIEDFIVAKPNAKKLLSREEMSLDELFPKTRKIAETVATEKTSSTAVHLGYTANSVYDLKSNEEKNYRDFGPISRGNNNGRILQKRLKKGLRFPQINTAKSEEKKENSMVSLIELWTKKKGSFSGELGCSEPPNHKLSPGRLPAMKLAPLSTKNSFQIKPNASDLYDPFKQAERQMLALLSWPSTTDVKTTSKDFSPKTKRNSNSVSSSKLQTSPTSAFSRYPNKSEKPEKISKNSGGAKKNLTDAFANEDKAATGKKRSVSPSGNRNDRLEKPTYESADDWERIFEKHFDLNKNEMMTRSAVKSALDDLLLKNTLPNHDPRESSAKKDKLNVRDSDRVRSPLKNRNNLSDNSIIEQIFYTSTPKQQTKSSSRDRTYDLNRDDKLYEKRSGSMLGSATPTPTPTADLDDETFSRGEKNRNSGVSLSGLSFSSQISDTTLADEEVMRSNLEIVGKAAAAAAVSRTPRRKYARSQSVFEERNRMLFAKTYDPNGSSSDEENIAEPLPKIRDKPETNKSPSRNSHPKPIPSNFYRSQSVFDGRCKGDGDHTDEGDPMSSPESNRNRKAKLSGDSAYSSLNRRSPRQSQAKKNSIQEDRLSSGESDASLRVTGNSDHHGRKKGGTRKSACSSADPDLPDLPAKREEKKPVKMSKFCHECGSKYPVAVAKFCCECGVRRLVI